MEVDEMPKPRPKVKKKASATPEVDTGNAEAVAEVEESESRAGVLRWNDERDEALVEAIRDNPEATYEEVAEILAAQPAFEGAEVTAFKVRKQRSRIAKAVEEAGVEIPQARRSVGSRQTYTTNVDRIASLFK